MSSSGTNAATSRSARPCTIVFCCTNVDMYSLQEFRELERLGMAPQEVHCLGLCHYCAQGRMAVVGDMILLASTPEDFWSALRPLLPKCHSAVEPEVRDGVGDPSSLELPGPFYPSSGCDPMRG